MRISRKLKKQVITDLKERGTWREIDEHLVDEYCEFVALGKWQRKELRERGLMYEDERGVERANPLLRSINSTESSINQLAKTLGIGPYSRKLSTGSDPKENRSVTKVSQLRPRQRKAAN